MVALPSPEVVLALSPDVVQRLLATFGRPDGLEDASPDALALARRLFSGRSLPPKLLRALLFVARFATAAGRGAIVEGARAAGDRRAEEWLAARPGDVAAKIAIERAQPKSRARRTAERIARLALLRMERDLPERPTYELVANAPIARDWSVKDALAKAFGAALVDAWVQADRDGSLRVALFLRLPTVTHLALNASGAIAPHDGARVAVDLLRIAPDGARVSICLATPELLPRYVDALGLSLRPSLTLKPLHDIAAKDIARLALPRGVRVVQIVALRRRTPDGARVEARAPDVLAGGDLLASAQAGYIDRTTIRVLVGDRTVDAFLQLPHRVEISDPTFAVEVRAVLTALGLFDPGALPDDARSLAPYTHPDWRWRDVVFDAGFETLLRRKLVTRVEVAHVATAALRMHGTSYVVRRVPGTKGTEYALAEDRAYGASLVEPADRVAWRLDLAALAGAMRDDFGAAPVDKAAAIEGALDLGLITLKSGKLRVVYLLTAPPPGWLENARRACGIGVTLVVLVPRGHAAGLEGTLVMELDVEEQLGVKRIGRVLGRAAEALGVANEVEPWRTCDDDVVIETATRRVWVCGVFVPLGDLPYRLLELLAKGDGVLPTKDLGMQLSRGQYPDEAARRVKMKLEEQVSEHLARAGIVWDAAKIVVTEGKKGYRLGVSVRVVSGGERGSADARSEKRMRR